MNVLDELALAMERAADQLAHGSVVDQAWASHLHRDRRAILLRAWTADNNHEDELVTNGRDTR